MHWLPDCCHHISKLAIITSDGSQISWQRPAQHLLTADVQKAAVGVRTLLERSKRTRPRMVCRMESGCSWISFCMKWS